MDLRSVADQFETIGTGIFHPTLVHPKTGLPLEAVGVINGTVLWPVLGASDDDSDPGGGDDDTDDDKDNEDEDEDESEDDDSDDDDDDEDDKGKGKKTKPTLKSAQAKIAALEDEKARHFKQRQKAEKKAADLEARLKAIEEKDLKPEEKEKRAKAEQDAKDKAAAAAQAQLMKENAFLRANQVDWIDREDAMKLVDWDEVEVSDDGTVDRKSLAAELKRLAKAKPHLVKKAKSQSDSGDNDEGAEDDKGQRSSSSTMNGKRSKGTKEPSRDELARRFPALNRH